MAPALEAIRYERGQVRVRATTRLRLRFVEPYASSLLLGVSARSSTC